MPIASVYSLSPHIFHSIKLPSSPSPEIMSRLSIIPDGHFPVLLSLFFSAVIDMLISLSMLKYFLLLASLMSQCVDIYPTSYISPTSLPTSILLLSLNGGLPQAFVLGPFIYICSLPQSCGFQCHGQTHPFHQQQSSSMTHWALRTRQTSYHGLWKSFCFTASSMFFTLSLTLSPLLVIHITLSFLFFVPWTHKHALSCHRDFVLDVPYDWEALQYSRGCIFSAIPISSHLWVPYLKWSQ